jgi:4-hydroxy 2-oxovalerate aldolase
MRAKLGWGYAIPYLVTGYLNQHPRTAMKFMEETDGTDIVKFYDAAIEEE